MYFLNLTFFNRVFFKWSKFISKPYEVLYYFSNQMINFMPLERHSILVYSLGDKKPAKILPQFMQNVFLETPPLQYFSIRNGSILYYSRPSSIFQNVVYSICWSKVASDDLSSIPSRYVSKYSQCDYNPGPLKVPKDSHHHSNSYSPASCKRVVAKSHIPKCLFCTW